MNSYPLMTVDEHTDPTMEVLKRLPEYTPHTTSFEGIINAYSDEIPKLRDKFIKEGFLEVSLVRGFGLLEYENVSGLKTILKERGLKVSGKRAELINRIKENVPEDYFNNRGTKEILALTEQGRQRLEDYESEKQQYKLEALNKIYLMIHNDDYSDAYKTERKIFRSILGRLDAPQEAVEAILTCEMQQASFKLFETFCERYNINCEKVTPDEFAYGIGLISNLRDYYRYKDTGIKEYTVFCTLDHITCEECGAKDRKKFSLNEAILGTTFPPFHHKCRCCTLAYFEDDDDSDETRIARSKNGKTYEVPASMTFIKWKKKYANK